MDLVSEINVYIIIIYTCKYSHRDVLVPVFVSQLFKTNNEYHNYNTRNCACIQTSIGITEASYRTFGFFYLNWINLILMRPFD